MTLVAAATGECCPEGITRWFVIIAYSDGLVRVRCPMHVIRGRCSELSGPCVYMNDPPEDAATPPTTASADDPDDYLGHPARRGSNGLEG